MIKYGKITVKIEEEIIYELDILAKNDVRKKEILDYYKDFLYNMNEYLVKGLMISNNL